MKKLILTCTIFALAGCGDDNKETTNTGGSSSACDSSLTFDSDIKTIVQSGGTGNCAASGCHSNYGTLSGISANKSSILARVKSTSASTVMPKNKLDFKTSDDGVKLISWLSCDTLN
ncbi:MAG: hypothetical protein RJB13_1857 [Pseudomonadota bacterium]|jgi:hypothetical protein